MMCQDHIRSEVLRTSGGPEPEVKIIRRRMEFLIVSASSGGARAARPTVLEDLEKTSCAMFRSTAPAARGQRGLRRAFILPHVRPAGDPHHHGERRLCPASAEALPARVLALVRPCAAGGRGGQAHVPHHSAGKDPLDPGGLWAGERRFPPHQLRRARNRLLPAEASSAGRFSPAAA